MLWSVKRCKKDELQCIKLWWSTCECCHSSLESKNDEKFMIFICTRAWPLLAGWNVKSRHSDVKKSRGRSKTILEEFSSYFQCVQSHVHKKKGSVRSQSLIIELNRYPHCYLDEVLFDNRHKNIPSCNANKGRRFVCTARAKIFSRWQNLISFDTITYENFDPMFMQLLMPPIFNQRYLHSYHVYHQDFDISIAGLLLLQYRQFQSEYNNWLKK